MTQKTHPSDTISEATDFYDAIRRFKDACAYERDIQFSWEPTAPVDPESQKFWNRSMEMADEAAAIHRRHMTEARKRIEAIEREATAAIVAELRGMGVFYEQFADAIESGDFGAMAF